jgi:porin
MLWQLSAYGFWPDTVSQKRGSSLFTHTTCFLLAIVAATALAANSLAQPPDPAADDPPPLTPEPAAQPPPGAAAGVHSTPTAAVETPEAVSPPFGGPIWERNKLTGDWNVRRYLLWESGITLDVSTTQFYQGVASGGLEQEFRYGGRDDYFFNVDGEKIGLWKGFFVNLHGESRYGESANFLTGALSPVNELLLVPAEKGYVPALTGVKFVQFLSENIEVFFGKINLFFDIGQPLTGAAVLDGFLNTSLIFHTILARTLPYSSFGAGFVYLKDKNPVFVLSVYDTNSTPTTTGFQSFFNNGVLIYPILNLPTHFFGLPGHQGLQGTYSSGKYTNLSPSPYLDPLNGLVFASPPKAGSWALAYNFDQALQVAPDDPKRVWGVFGGLAIADDNPNPIQWYASAGISGASPIPVRKRDTFGIGYFHLGISGPLKQSAQPFSPLGNEDGLELYYNARITPWFQMTPDLQVINPFEQQAKTALVLGLRGKLDF